VRFELDISSSQPLSGALTNAHGTAVAFRGRLGLLSLIDRMTAVPDRHPDSGDMDAASRVPQPATQHLSAERQASEPWLGDDKGGMAGAGTSPPV
jgi:hypothetical protein